MAISGVGLVIVGSAYRGIGLSLEVCIVSGIRLVSPGLEVIALFKTIRNRSFELLNTVTESALV